jgi:hypothetical protein
MLKDSGLEVWKVGKELDIVTKIFFAVYFFKVSDAGRN